MDRVPKPRDERQKDLFRPAPDQIIDMGHLLARLAGEIDWGFLEQRFAAGYATEPGQPPLRPGRWRGSSRNHFCYNSVEVSI
jgi:hypothetical protein